MNPKNYEENTKQCFDSYCKSVLKRTARECYTIIKRRTEKEIAFSAMPAHDLANLAVTDKYFHDEDVFNILNENISISKPNLANALTLLPADKREIILMSYFFDMTDREIAERLNMAQRNGCLQGRYHRSTVIFSLTIWP